MALDTYANLQAAAAGYLDRDDLAAAVPDFIRLCEAEAQRDIQHWRMEKLDEAFTIDSRYTDLPNDFLAPLRLEVSATERPLRLTDPDDLHERRDAGGNATGVPRFYTVLNGTIEVWPTPGQSYTASLLYRRTLPALSDSNTTNWLLDLAPDVYLYGALKQSAPYLVEDERVAVWGQFYDRAIFAVNAEGERGKYGGKLNRRVKR